MKKIFKAIILSLGALLLALAPLATLTRPAQAATNPSSVAAIKKRGTLRVAVFGDLKPYGWVNKTASGSATTFTWRGAWPRT